MGRVLSTLLAENRQETLIQRGRRSQWALNAGDQSTGSSSVDSVELVAPVRRPLVGDRSTELMDFTDKVRRDPNHELRHRLLRFPFEFADDLQNDLADHAPRPSRSRSKLDGPRRGHPGGGDGGAPSSAWCWKVSTIRPARCARGSRIPVVRIGNAARRRRTARQGDNWMSVGPSIW